MIFALICCLMNIGLAIKNDNLDAIFGWTIATIFISIVGLQYEPTKNK
jgi:hypothetical protein